ncbi:alkylhydroperoxidase AhpD family core domain-containing protein [Nocardia amikacinitolerans]|uniref:Alkylhydroperoxidase AhpD family core domain-containing protein n=3 Tax=Nocardia amikacinitolerans TaxID=756689 RepID=A0A285L8H1_9NOCA|nr:GNAT family N-acetyltransferase [Nocardia amikacinitolerans]MCP2277695.1 alkylhydroperoxidase AhpD family core domain-containing protein [Nocardia amikacinitolerans]SNY81182.1 alkylhydroperoxidase AhpD family core domain-containing protein [Nocardia amikacinitolerans]
MNLDNRVWVDKQTPVAYRALLATAKEVRAAAAAAGLDRRLVELVNMRVSQLNGCTHCLDVHHRAALRAGATEQEIAVLPGWRRGGPYSALDRAALALAEVTAVLPDEATLEREYALAREHLSDDQMSVIVWVATTIGAFNRVSIMSQHPVRAHKEEATMTDLAETKVARNAEQNRYEIYYGGELAGFTEYVERGNDSDFVHTEIDKAFEGKGLGSKLAKEALDDVVARGRTITAHCPFIKAYIEKHPEYEKHMTAKSGQQ